MSSASEIINRCESTVNDTKANGIDDVSEVNRISDHQKFNQHSRRVSAMYQYIVNGGSP